MAGGEAFDSSVRSAGDLAGVYEHDGETGYFYLYETEGRKGQKVVESIHVLSGEPDFAEEDVAIRWNPEEQWVGLFIKEVLWAAFDSSHRTPYGGNYRPGAKTSLPSEAEERFDDS